MKIIYIIFPLIAIVLLSSIYLGKEKEPAADGTGPINVWVEYEDVDFSFSHPPEFSEIKKEPPFTYFFRPKEKDGGHLYVRTKSEAINPNRFSGLQGIVTDPDKFLVGEKVWYSWVEKDKKCMERALMVQIEGIKTLVMGFRSYLKDFPIHNDIPFIKTVLDTFRFN